MREEEREGKRRVTMECERERQVDDASLVLPSSKRMGFFFFLRDRVYPGRIAAESERAKEDTREEEGPGEVERRPTPDERRRKQLSNELPDIFPARFVFEEKRKQTGNQPDPGKRTTKQRKMKSENTSRRVQTSKGRQSHWRD